MVGEYAQYQKEGRICFGKIMSMHTTPIDYKGITLPASDEHPVYEIAELRHIEEVGDWLPDGESVMRSEKSFVSLGAKMPFMDEDDDDDDDKGDDKKPKPDKRNIDTGDDEDEGDDKKPKPYKQIGQNSPSARSGEDYEGSVVRVQPDGFLRAISSDSGYDAPIASENILKSLATNVSERFSNWFGSKDKPNPHNGFAIVDKQQELPYDWVGWWSNNFKDREEEIIAEVALTSFVKSANEGEVLMPELWFAHTIGTRHGQAAKLFMLGHLAFAVGNFDSMEKPFVKRMLQWYKENPKRSMSHQFFYNPAMKIDGVYYHIETFEISSLPVGREANKYTLFMEKLT